MWMSRKLFRTLTWRGLRPVCSALRDGLVATLRSGRWNRMRLREMAATYGTKATLALVDEALHATEAGAA